jgi:hypothetical protein
MKTPTLLGAPAALALGLLLAGCGGTSHTAASNAPAAPARAATSSAIVPPSLSIVAPRRDARTGRSLTVRVAVRGTPASGSHSFRYVLDGRRARLGSARLTFHELAPGRHRIVVMLADDTRVRASRVFVVRTPAPVPASESAPTMATTTATPETPPATRTSPPRTTTQPSPPAPATTPSPAPPAEEAIPQGNGGDHDSDNNGGPSDGDGNV